MDERDAEERRAELLQQAAAGTAHDVNNLLLIVNACAAMALEDRTLSPDARELVREILEAGERATSLARQFLALGRPSEPPATVDVAGLVRSSETLLRRVLGPGITLVLVTGRTPLPVRAHASQLEQVILNLVLNACNAMPEGGTLTIACAPAVDERKGLPQSCGAGAPVVRLAVTDTGTGIDPAVQARMFEPYVTTRGAEQGSGLGLAVVRAIVDQLDGAIDVATAPRQGTTFTIDLPRVTDIPGA